MTSPNDIVVRLTERSCLAPQRRRDLQSFAEEAGWKPSDEIDEYPGTEEFANGHLLVEHGLDNAAVISFLRRHPHQPEGPTEEAIPPARPPICGP